MRLLKRLLCLAYIRDQDQTALARIPNVITSHIKATFSVSSALVFLVQKYLISWQQGEIIRRICYHVSFG
jgi:hypothetical protein